MPPLPRRQLLTLQLVDRRNDPPEALRLPDRVDDAHDLVGHVPADRAGGPDEYDHSGRMIVGARSPLA